MKCPICGCKMREQFMCPFCKITGDQVRNASNKEAIERIKKKNTKEVYISTYLPKDVNNTRLLLISLFGGFFGVHNIYVGKFKTGLFFAISAFFSLVSYILSHIIFKDVLWLQYVMTIGLIFGAINIFCWISSVFKILFRVFPMPVVLSEVKFEKKEKTK